ncbi:MAG TPA: FAD-dependent monooxygenase, partial [Ramlibacter sp.]|nr:FAD-dependent monooxygenase [Ramlibacter sp.]
RTDTCITAFEQDAAGVTAITQRGESLRGAALVGADGIRSRIRQRIVGDGEPVPIGAVIYRALVPAGSMPADLQHAYPTLWTGPRGHLIYYPVRDWTEFNVGATVVRDVAGLEEGEASQEEAMAAFETWTDVPRRVLRLATLYQRYLIRHREPVDNWTRGRVTLLGDAAHPMVQYIAQGAAMALEDALCLASELAAADGDMQAGFARYQEVRIVRTARVQLSSRMLDRLYHVGGVERLVRNSIFEGRSPAEYHERLSWLFTPPRYVSQWRQAAVAA